MSHESLKKCQLCQGTGDKLRRDPVIPSLKQQCPLCRGEGMVLDVSMWQKVLAEGGALELKIIRDAVNATPSTEPDYCWTYLDKENHLHRWNRRGGLSTLKHIVGAEGTDERPEAKEHYECRRCGDTVEPGYKSTRHPSPEARILDPQLRLVEYSVNGESVGRRTLLAVWALIEKGS